MLCDLCKSNTAAIHIEKHNGENKTQLKVCCECAGIEGLTPENINGESLQKLINGVYSMQNKKTASKCLTCDTDSESFERTGRVGCPDCYTYLSSSINIQSWQKTPHTKHIGKTPFNYEINSDLIDKEVNHLKDLEDKLIICISKEDYEKAAILRDRIEEMKKATP